MTQQPQAHSARNIGDQHGLRRDSSKSACVASWKARKTCQLKRTINFGTVLFVTRQGELNFDSPGNGEGHTRWLAGRRVAMAELARRIGLPLGHEVEVWLYGGIRLRGRLLLQEELLFVEEDKVRHLGLMVDKFHFAYREMESCVRLD
jgi:hypothetical protein